MCDSVSRRTWLVDRGAGTPSRISWGLERKQLITCCMLRLIQCRLELIMHVCIISRIIGQPSYCK